MKIAGIITEYNPFHNGHKYQILKAKKDLSLYGLIVVMSGNFVQRGEPAIISKYDRAKVAVLNGIDLVLELPTFFSLQSGKHFGKAGVDILKASGVVDYLVFGSEEEDLNKLQRLLSLEDDKEFNLLIRKNLSKGFSFGESKRQAYKLLFQSRKLAELDLGPNDTLALEYLKALKTTNIKPYNIKRQGSYHSLEVENSFLSASGIRERMKDNKLENLKDYMPESSYQILLESYNNKNNLDDETIFKLIRFLTSIEKRKMDSIISYEDGLENLIKKNLSAKSYLQLLENSTSKRYTKSRIKRFLLSYILDFRIEQVECAFDSLYLRPLAFNSRGREILALIKSRGKLPIISKFSSDFNEVRNFILDSELKASNLYNINKGIMNEDFYKSPTFIK